MFFTNKLHATCYETITPDTTAHLLTNFPDEELGLYQRAIAAYDGEANLFICNTAFTANGMHLQGYHALWVYGKQDLSDFWRIFRQIRDNQ
jgi:hypothetical protein